MSFRMSQPARQYLESLHKYSATGEFQYRWDPYYLFFMVGCLKGVLGDDPGGKFEFEKEFIGRYVTKKYELIAELVAAEIKRQGIKMESETAVGGIMNQLLDPDSVTNLSDKGHEAMNCYAQGGFEVVSEQIDDPRDLADFLLRFRTLYCEQ